ncbi:MAG: tetratricopeptide repeat protein [Muribaculaceae bacterium]|nr:tetratricopeptide repeat protein [Muribaculaceae bacterium]MDE6298245.1 tetratricopeptide repeat protein [Muribaculaceae bacterium]
MASQNGNQQDENAIDKMNSQLTAAGDKIANNKKYIFWGVGAILIAGVFALSYIFIFRNPRLNDAYEAYNKVELNAMGNDSIAAEQYKAVADKYKGNDAGKLAALSAGETLYNLGKYQEAADYLKRFSSSDDVLEANALALTGDCYVNLKKYDEALSYFDKSIKKADKNPQIVPRVLLKEANVYDEQKKYDKALDCYTQIKNDYPDFMPGNGLDIDAYIARENARLGK